MSTLTVVLFATTIAGFLITVGGLVWKLSSRLTNLETRMESDVKGLMAEVKHLADKFEIRVAYAAQQDTMLLNLLSEIKVEIREIKKDMWEGKKRE